MALVDLHTHSTASDGTLSPSELVRAAEERGLAALALTDHDTVDGLAEAAAEAEGKSLEFVPGCELAVKKDRLSMDILGLWLPVEPRGLKDKLAFLNRERAERNERIVSRLQKAGVDLTYDEVKALAGGTVGRPHIARALLDKGYVSSVQEAFDVYLGAGGKAFVPKTVLPPEEAVGLLKAEGATVILAHPYMYNLSQLDLERVVRELAGAGLDGIEAHYSEHSSGQTRFYLQLAEKLGLAVSGGSDFHGAVKPNIRLGEGKGNLAVDVSVLEALKKRRAAQGLGS